MSSPWTHSICELCWNLKYPEGRTPVRLKEHARHITECCYCGLPTASGIFVREDPSTVKCAGEHKENVENAT